MKEKYYTINNDLKRKLLKKYIRNHSAYKTKHLINKILKLISLIIVIGMAWWFFTGSYDEQKWEGLFMRTLIGLAFASIPFFIGQSIDITGIRRVYDVNEDGIAQTRYTWESVKRGLRAFKSNSAIDGVEDKGIRTLLTDNFKSDVIKAKEKILNPSTWKEGFKNKLNDFKSFKDMWGKGIEWEKRRKYIKTSANTIKSFIDTSRVIESITVKEFDVKSHITDKLKDFNDMTKFYSKSVKAKKNYNEYMKSYNKYNENLDKYNLGINYWEKTKLGIIN